MKKIGITGGIGSGKSTITNYFKRKGYEVQCSDKIVSQLYEKPKKEFVNLLLACGLKNISQNKKIDKKIITKKIFFNKKLKNIIEKYIHKQVRLERERFIKEQLKLKRNLIFLDIPLLLENNLEKQFDITLSIISTKKNRTMRVMKDKKFSKEILNMIFKNQTSDKDRRLRSDIVINNNKTKKDFVVQADKVLRRFLK